MATTLRTKLELLKSEAANAKIGVFTTPDVRLAAEHILRKVGNG